MNQNFIDIKIEKLLYLLNHTILKNKTPNYYDKLSKSIYNSDMALKNYFKYEEDNITIIHYYDHDAYLIIYNVNKINYLFEFYYYPQSNEYKNIDISIYYNKNIKFPTTFGLYTNSYVIKYSLSNNNNDLRILYKFKFYNSIILKKIDYKKINNHFYKRFIIINMYYNNYIKTLVLYDYSNKKILNNFNINECKDICELYSNIFKIYQLYNNNEITKEKMNNLINYNESLYFTNLLIN